MSETLERFIAQMELQASTGQIGNVNAMLANLYNSKTIPGSVDIDPNPYYQNDVGIHELLIKVSGSLEKEKVNT